MYNILKKEVVERATGTSQKSTIMATKVLRKLNCKFNNACGLSQRESAKRHEFAQYISPSLGRSLILNVIRKKVTEIYRRSNNYNEVLMSLDSSQLCNKIFNFR